MEKNKFLILLFSVIIAAFFGSFLASYIILTPNNPEPIFAPKTPNVTFDINKQRKNLTNQEPSATDFPIFGNNLLNVGNVTSIKTEETKDGYKIKIDLKPYNNDPKNVAVKIRGRNVSISAQYQSKNKQGASSSKIYQSFTLPEKIDEKTVKQEKAGNYLVITILKKSPKK